MHIQALPGRSILIVEDEPQIVMDAETEFANTGAQLIATSTYEHAVIFVEYDRLSAAILDHAIGEVNCSRLYERLHEREIPFIIYSGHDIPEADRRGGTLIQKPALPGVLVAAVENLLRPQAWHLLGEPTPAA